MKSLAAILFFIGLCLFLNGQELWGGGFLLLTFIVIHFANLVTKEKPDATTLRRW